MADLRIRCTIARLAAYQGRVTDAMAHLDRALDLIGGQAQYRNLSLNVTRATVLLEASRPAEASALRSQPPRSRACRSTWPSGCCRWPPAPWLTRPRRIAITSEVTAAPGRSR